MYIYGDEATLALTLPQGVRTVPALRCWTLKPVIPVPQKHPQNAYFSQHRLHTQTLYTTWKPVYCSRSKRKMYARHQHCIDIGRWKQHAPTQSLLRSLVIWLVMRAWQSAWEPWESYYCTWEQCGSGTFETLLRPWNQMWNLIKDNLLQNLTINHVWRASLGTVDFTRPEKPSPQTMPDNYLRTFDRISWRPHLKSLLGNIWECCLRTWLVNLFNHLKILLWNLAGIYVLADLSLKNVGEYRTFKWKFQDALLNAEAWVQACVDRKEIK